MHETPFPWLDMFEDDPKYVNVESGWADGEQAEYPTLRALILQVAHNHFWMTVCRGVFCLQG